MLNQPRWTHVALPVADLESSIAWYLRFTPLVVVQRHADEAGENAWLAHEGQREHPFVLVLVMFHRSRGQKQPMLAPFAHIGIEMPRRVDVDATADRGREAGCLVWEPRLLP